MKKTPKKSTAGRGRPRKILGSEDTRERLLNIAERLFATSGFFGVSIKEIAKEAGVDTALLHYYFRDRQGMLDSIFDRRAKEINQRRMNQLSRYKAEVSSEMTIEGALEAYLRPMFDLALSGDTGWRNYFSLMSQVSNVPGWGSELMTKYGDPIIHRFVELLRSISPNSTKENLYWCFVHLSGSLMQILSLTRRIDRLSSGSCRSDDLRTAYARFLPYATAGFTSARSSATRRPARPKANNAR
jgi:AcrR family transcriptional regulator